MSHINLVRLVVAGMVAGLIINASGITFAHFVLGPDYIEAFKEKMPQQSDTMMLIKHTGLRLWFGLLAVFIYVGFRTRFGPGAGTAVLVRLDPNPDPCRV